MRPKLTLKKYNVDDYYPGKRKPGWLQKISSENVSRLQSKKIMNWVFQALAKDRDWINLVSCIGWMFYLIVMCTCFARYFDNNKLNPFTFAKWLSDITATMLKPYLNKESVYWSICWDNRTPSILTSGTTFPTNGIKFFWIS